MEAEGFARLVDVARRAGITYEHAKQLANRGDLYDVRIGRWRMVPTDEADAFVAFIERLRVSSPDPDRKRGRYCYGSPGKRCLCPCHASAAGKTKAGAKRRLDAWTRQQDEMLRALLADGGSPSSIAEALASRFPDVPRTPLAVRERIHRLGLSRRDGWLSGEEVIEMLGVYRRRVQDYEARGLLTAAPWGRWRRYRLAEVEALVRQEAGLTIDPRRVLDPKLKSVAEVAAVVNRRRASA